MRRALLRLLESLRPNRAERELSREIRAHLQLIEDKHIANGMTPTEARYAALREFGGVEQAKAHHRDARMFRAVAGWRMDLKLGGRMLVKYPWLSIVGGLAMAFAVAVGAVIFQVLSLFVHPTLPLSQGERLVQLRNWDVSANTAEPRALYDFDLWRRSLTSVTELGAWRETTRNLVVSGDARPVQAAEVTSSAFRVADGTPLLGRVLTDNDARPGAPAVAVIGYDLWTERFGSNPGVLGTDVQLGTSHVTVVGVMRKGFAFPISHEVWTPFVAASDQHAPGTGPAISVFGLLSPGASLGTAKAELKALGQRVATEEPATHAHLEARLAPYTTMDGSLENDELGIMASIYVFTILLVALICSNIALLLFARAATRESELTLRTALGASRGRIVAQMFAEALVLGGVAAVIGLVTAGIVLNNWGMPFLEANLPRIPFWYDLSLAPATMLYAMGLAIFGSAIAGVVPAMKVTRGMSSRLKQASAGAGGLQFGGIWTFIIVAQVAVTVAFPAIVYQEQWQLRHVETFDAGFPTEKYLGAEIRWDAASTGDNAEATDVTREARRLAFAGRLDQLRRRVAAEPGVAGVTFANRLPRTQGPWSRIEIAGDADRANQPGGADDADGPLRVVTVAGVDASYFDTLDTPVLAGRTFTAADLRSSDQVAIVDQSFVDQVLQGRNPIGQQVRFPPRRNEPNPTPGPWMEIVGVVKELGMGAPTTVGREAGLYLPAPPERLNTVYLLAHVPGDPLTLAPTLREIAAAIDPALRLSDVQRVDQVTAPLIWVIRMWIRITATMTIVALVLSLSGIYAVLSFVVARRTREIGVRVALGASRWSVISAIFRRPLIQVGLGVIAGSALLALMGSVKTEMPGLSGDLTLSEWVMLAGYCFVMLGVCLLACIVPTRRALSVEPTVALRMD